VVDMGCGNYDWIGRSKSTEIPAKIPFIFSNVIPSTKGCVKVAYVIVKEHFYSNNGKIAGNNMGVMTSHKWTRNHRYNRKVYHSRVT